MTKLPRVRARQVLRVLRRDGWYEEDLPSSGHRSLRHVTKPGKVAIPVHSGKIIGPGLLKSILNQAGLTGVEFRRLL